MISSKDCVVNWEFGYAIVPDVVKFLSLFILKCFTAIYLVKHLTGQNAKIYLNRQLGMRTEWS